MTRLRTGFSTLVLLFSIQAVLFLAPPEHHASGEGDAADGGMGAALTGLVKGLMESFAAVFAPAPEHAEGLETPGLEMAAGEHADWLL